MARGRGRTTAAPLQLDQAALALQAARAPHVATRAGRPAAVRAAGTALATNPIPIVVPCHRVLRTGGQLGAYRGGPDAKARLLALEGSRTRCALLSSSQPRARRPLHCAGIWSSGYTRSVRRLDDADDLLSREPTAIAFFDAMIERYPDHLGRTVLWAGASALYDVREHPDQDVGEILVASWL